MSKLAHNCLSLRVKLATFTQYYILVKKNPRSLGVFEIGLKFSERRQFAQILILFFISFSQQAVVTLYVYVCINVYLYHFF